ncbi:prospero homeobox protein 1-like isoform X1 [Lates japonicus]|uniref:Prospero homeobox protein 1-like isoform X1 n=1 Tax=Lates japonicus TaxID=270547 RepID=A0AAD3R0B4_LATJO|nr:prospero homeobox protein 1-like isoform X1 [Lates japonicus]
MHLLPLSAPQISLEFIPSPAQPGGASRRIGGQLNTNLSTHRHLEDRNLEDDGGERDGQVEQVMEGGEEGVLEEEDSLLEVKKRHSDGALAAEWSQDVLKVKRMKLERRQRDGEADGEASEGGRRREGGREGKRRREGGAERTAGGGKRETAGLAGESMEGFWGKAHGRGGEEKDAQEWKQI